MGEMIASVGKVDRLDRRACRAHVAGRFSVERMVDSYEIAYRRVLEAPAGTTYLAGKEELAPLALVASGA